MTESVLLVSLSLGSRVTAEDWSLSSQTCDAQNLANKIGQSARLACITVKHYAENDVLFSVIGMDLPQWLQHDSESLPSANLV